MRVRVFGLLMLLVAATDAQPAPRRRALLIGINDYTASTLGAHVPDRDWRNLRGSVNDLRTIEEMLVLLHGFHPRDIVTLTDQSATRAAILSVLEEHLMKPAAKGDTLFFYYAGHGSQAPNSLSDEADRMDETLVPADSRAGARDIRDKELRPLFNRILDRGARLTILLDNCHSGSGTRGLPSGARSRSVKPDPRDVADRTSFGPRPEDRGALVLAAAQDFDDAWETRDQEKKFHGTFSWAWIRAMRDASPNETAGETFLRARARMRFETPFQEPVLAGKEAERHPFLGGRTDRREERFVVPVERVRKDGTVVLLAGWAHGLSPETELRVSNDRQIRLIVTKMLGLGRSEARLPAGQPMPQAIRSGALLEVAGWAAPPARALRVLMPRRSGDAKAIAALAGRLSAEATRRRVRWVKDPLEEPPSYVLRAARTKRPGHMGGWELLGPDGKIALLGDDAAAVAALTKLPKHSSLFVQLPAPAATIEAIAIGPGTDRDGFEPVDRAEEADYILVGRFTGRRVEYAWVRPSVRSSDRRKSGLPLRTDWAPEDAASLRDSALRLRRIQAWQLLESPPEGRSPYRLVLRRGSGGAIVQDATVIGEETYEPILSAARTPGAELPPRYFYVFVIDSHGKSVLVFPADGTGSVENRFPLASPPPRDIPLGERARLVIEPPYGIDTYYLLSTDEPLPNPWILEWNGVRTRSPQSPTALEQLLLLTGSETRASSISTPRAWSIEKVDFESVPPRKRQ
ncbi:MAG TPA: caspase family protein [Thermoanaerobaculia bacterium]|nr:caspase family protein [Thermoanaerobaculia bacterium]